MFVFKLCDCVPLTPEHTHLDFKLECLLLDIVYIIGIQMHYTILSLFFKNLIYYPLVSNLFTFSIDGHWLFHA